MWLSLKAYISSNEIVKYSRMLIRQECGRNMIIVCFKMLSIHLLGETEENNETSNLANP
jgi:hypothetical protein